MRTAIVYLIALGAVVAAVMLGFPELFTTAAATEGNGAGQEEQDNKPTPVVVAAVIRSPFIDTLEALGTVIANESVAITPNRADHVGDGHRRRRRGPVDDWGRGAGWCLGGNPHDAAGGATHLRRRGAVHRITGDAFPGVGRAVGAG